MSAPRPLRTRRRSLPEFDDVGSRRCGVAMQMVFGCSGRMRLVPCGRACVRRTAAFETNFCAHWRAGRIGGQCERQRRALQRLKPLARGRKRNTARGADGQHMRDAAPDFWLARDEDRVAERFACAARRARKAVRGSGRARNASIRRVARRQR